MKFICIKFGHSDLGNARLDRVKSIVIHPDFHSNTRDTEYGLTLLEIGAEATGAAAMAGGAAGAPSGFMRELHHLWKPLPLSGPRGIRITLGGRPSPETASSACPAEIAENRRGGATITGCIIIMGESMGIYLTFWGPLLGRRPPRPCPFPKFLKIKINI